MTRVSGTRHTSSFYKGIIMLLKLFETFHWCYVLVTRQELKKSSEVTTGQGSVYVCTMVTAI